MSDTKDLGQFQQVATHCGAPMVFGRSTVTWSATGSRRVQTTTIDLWCARGCGATATTTVKESP